MARSTRPPRVRSSAWLRPATPACLAFAVAAALTPFARGAGAQTPDPGCGDRVGGSGAACTFARPDARQPQTVTPSLAFGPGIAAGESVRERTPRSAAAFLFNLEWDAVAPGGFPLNPRWVWQRTNPFEATPDPHLCHYFSKTVTVGTTSTGSRVRTQIPSFADCTDQTTYVDRPTGLHALVCRHGPGPGFRGHVNWFVVTDTGRAKWDELSTDNDYNIKLETVGRPGVTSSSGLMGLEFDSDETIDEFGSWWWNRFHSTVDNGNPSAMVDGKHTIVTGVFGLDCEHGCRSEVHPVYAIAINVQDDQANDAWAMFVRNWGNEGYCSSSNWMSPFTTYTFRLPWRPGMDSVRVLLGPNRTEFQGTTGTAGPAVVYTRGQGVDVTFGLPLPEASPLIDGVLHLQWFGRPATHGPLTGGVARETISRGAGRDTIARVTIAPGAVAAAAAAQDTGDAEQRIGAAINRLPPAERERVARARAPERTRTLRALPPVAAARASAALTAAPRTAVRLTQGPVAARKLARDAAQLRAVCAAYRDSVPGFSRGICTRGQREPR